MLYTLSRAFTLNIAYYTLLADIGDSVRCIDKACRPSKKTWQYAVSDDPMQTTRVKYPSDS